MRILLVDDSIMVRARLTTLLSDIPGVEIVGHAESEDEAFTAIRLKQPDVIVLDISLESGNGVQLLRRMKQADLRINTIMLTNEVASAYKNVCLANGAMAFFDKSMDLEELVTTIRSMT